MSAPKLVGLHRQVRLATTSIGTYTMCVRLATTCIGTYTVCVRLAATCIGTFTMWSCLVLAAPPNFFFSVLRSYDKV